jgi:hypothetical protein
LSLAHRVFSARSRASSARSDSANGPEGGSAWRRSACTRLCRVYGLIPRSRATRATDLSRYEGKVRP